MSESNTSIVSFTDVSFFWPDPSTGKIEAGSKPVFSGFTADIPGGFVSLTGPNGAGKTTFMLLAGARVLPIEGVVRLFGMDTRILSGASSPDGTAPGPGLTPDVEHRRSLACSYIYQNMEFEKDSAGELSLAAVLDQVYEGGGLQGNAEDLKKTVYSVFELEKLKDRRLDALSKGEQQRVYLAFSALYGSKSIMMDEPMFAMEPRQKEKALDFFKNLCRETSVSVYVSLHELALTRKYFDTVMLFHSDRSIDLGTPEEVLTAESLEKAYGVPEAMLYDGEKLTRAAFVEEVDIIKDSFAEK